MRSAIKSHFFNTEFNLSDIQSDIDFLINVIKTPLESSGAEFVISFYTYDNFSAMSSQTDHNGVTIFYRRDKFGRLFQTLDQDGYAIRQNEYNYGN